MIKQATARRSGPGAVREERSGPWFRRRGALRCTALALAAAGLVGCGPEPGQPAASGSASAEVRGEPIVAPAVTAVVPSSTGAVEVVRSIPLEVAAPVAASDAPATTPALASGVSATPAAAPEAEAQSGLGTTASPLSVGFEKLGSFQYTLPEGPVDTNTVAQSQAAAQIPGTIKALNNQFVSLKGFMLPLKVEKGLVTELLIMRDQSMCCYGTVPRINEWVSVKMVSTGVKPVMDQAVTFFGKLKVGEMYENGYLVGIYAMEGEKMAGPLDL